MIEATAPDELGALRLAVRRLQESEERLRPAPWATRTATWEWDVASGQVSVSDSMGTLARHALDPATFPYPGQLAAVYADDRDAVALAARRTLEEGADDEVEFRVAARGGGLRWHAQKGRVIATGPDGRAVRAAGVVTEVTKRRRLQEALSHQASHDPLTDLPNRTLFSQRLSEASTVPSGRGSPVALLCLDLDGFKAVNDRFGHEAGDRLLVAIGGRLRALVPEGERSPGWAGTSSVPSSRRPTGTRPRGWRPAPSRASVVRSESAPARPSSRSASASPSPGLASCTPAVCSAAPTALYRRRPAGAPSRSSPRATSPARTDPRPSPARPPIPRRRDRERR